MVFRLEAFFFVDFFAVVFPRADFFAADFRPLAFFVAAWAYVRGCERITAVDEPDGEGSR